VISDEALPSRGSLQTPGAIKKKKNSSDQNTGGLVFIEKWNVNFLRIGPARNVRQAGKKSRKFQKGATEGKLSPRKNEKKKIK